MTEMSSFGNSALQSLRLMLATICFQIRYVSWWAWANLRPKSQPPSLGPCLPEEDLASEILAARLQRLAAERKLALTRSLAAEVAAVNQTLNRVRGALGQHS